MIRLGVNVDHVATVRQARRGHEPDPAHAAALAMMAGADGITIHLREDRRHIQERDGRVIRELVTHGLNLEMACADEVVQYAIALKPDQVTLVPEKRQELTTEGGLDVIANIASVGEAVKKLHGSGLKVAMFIDPDQKQIEACLKLGVHSVEFHTGTYADAPIGPKREHALQALCDASAIAVKEKVHIHLGHGLNYHNVQAVVRIPGVEELNIGHAIISRAIFVGMDRAVKEMKAAMQEHYPNEAMG
jgi:pyridoxine 5-phosphate synthase